MTRPRLLPRALFPTSATLAGIVVAAALAGCTGSGDTVAPAASASTAVATVTATPTAPSAPTPTAPSTAGGSAATQPEDAAKVRDALAGLAAGSVPGTDSVRAALVRAGYAHGAIEVTASRTPTGLDADAVEASVRQGGDCVVAQIRGRSVTATVLPALADGRCLAGPAA
ncbi:hypothetical protein QWJ39_09685 [Arthrobacter sp. YD4]|uniref:DUF6993 domain-containing protein n=1 Tax=Arthrobacter sp. YD4 TaxID=3058043 RepID=UPI0025B5D7AF|nr:hypothetical protein [Arthrobacter sp. YD4]MDN3936580.1 hypothetical protein [Arthrobacter sp. YD4]